MKRKNVLLDDSHFVDALDLYRKEMIEKIGGEIPPVAVWPEIVGDDIARHVDYIEAKNGRLYLKADHPVYKSLVLMKQREVISKINERFPRLKIKSISVS